MARMWSATQQRGSNDMTIMKTSIKNNIIIIEIIITQHNLPNNMMRMMTTMMPMMLHDWQRYDDDVRVSILLGRAINMTTTTTTTTTTIMTTTTTTSTTTTTKRTTRTTKMAMITDVREGCGQRRSNEAAMDMLGRGAARYVLLGWSGWVCGRQRAACVVCGWVWVVGMAWGEFVWCVVMVATTYRLWMVDVPSASSWFSGKK